MAHWRRGTKLNNGQYVIQSMLLGSTGSLAYKAIDTKNHNSIVVKTLFLGDSSQISQEQTHRIVKLAHSRHPNIVKISPKVFRQDDKFYIIMEYIEGENLASFLDENGRLTPQEALKIVAKIGSALNLLHQNRFIHQNLKPQNIILRSQDYEPILSDFGVVIDLFCTGRNKTNSHLIDSFTAPETYIQRNPAGAYTDIYSLAAILYVLITKQLPTPFNTREYKKLTPPQRLNSDITDQLNQAILKGLELDVFSRPQNLRQWFKSLQSSVNSDANTPDTKASRKITQARKKTNIEENKSVNSPAKKTYPKTKTFKFETVNIESQSKLFGLVSKINQNLNQKTTKYFSEKLEENTTIDMIYVPSGSFVMGSPHNEYERSKDENPQHRVSINSFYMSKFPITQEQWRVVASFDKIKRPLKSNPSCFKGDNLPVENISWYEAQEFCQRLSKKTQREYRLPSEGEWEYACRAGTTTPFYFGEMITTDFANYDGRTGYNAKPTGKYDKKTTPVDSFMPNPFGLYDLHGNVWEWCEDHYSPNYRSKPNDGNPYYSRMKNQPRLVRGGSWSLSASYCRSSKRGNYAPDANYNFVGFRIVCRFD